MPIFGREPDIEYLPVPYTVMTAEGIIQTAPSFFRYEGKGDCWIVFYNDDDEDGVRFNRDHVIFFGAHAHDSDDDDDGDDGPGDDFLGDDPDGSWGAFLEIMFDDRPFDEALASGLDRPATAEASA